MNTRNEIEEKFNSLHQTLKTQRDELKVQIHLANMEAKEEWDELEDKWEQFKLKTGQVRDEAKPSMEEIGSAISLLGEELKEGYTRIRHAIK